MALFTEKGAGAGGGGGESVAGLSIIGGGMRVVGDIEADGVVKIEGTVVGTVRAAKQVLVAKGGEVEGDVVSREAIVGGDAHGGIYADRRVGRSATSLGDGDVLRRTVLLVGGGEINGVLPM